MSTKVINFPKNESTQKMLFWMGEDYTDYIVEYLDINLKKQVPETEVLEINCTEMPNFKTLLNSDRKVTSINVEFQVEVLVKSLQQKVYRLTGLLFFQIDLTIKKSNVDGGFEIQKSESLNQ